MVAGWKDDSSNTRSLDDMLDVYIDAYNSAISQHTSKMHLQLTHLPLKFHRISTVLKGWLRSNYDHDLQKLERSDLLLEYDTAR